MKREQPVNPLYDSCRCKQLVNQVQTDHERLVRLLCRPAAPAVGRDRDVSAEALAEAAAFLRVSWDHLAQAVRQDQSIEGPLVTGLRHLRQAVFEALQMAEARLRER